MYGIVFDSVQRLGSRIYETMWLPLLLNVPFIPATCQQQVRSDQAEIRHGIRKP